jgi:hypothetical protein
VAGSRAGREGGWIRREAGYEPGSFLNGVGEQGGQAFPRGYTVLEDAEQAGELFFEVEQGALGCEVGGEMSESALKEVVEFWRGCGGFGGGLEELHKIGGCPEVGKGAPDAFMGVAEGDLAEPVQVRFPGGGEPDFAVEKEVDPT